jgi:hypothetical protein
MRINLSDLDGAQRCECLGVGEKLINLEALSFSLAFLLRLTFRQYFP